MIFEFQQCSLDDEACEFRNNGELVPLQPKLLDVLLYLLANRDRVVSKNELLDNVWADAAVGDGVLTRAINLIRSAVGDSGGDHVVIRTLPRKGYRFTADVTVKEGDGAVRRSPILIEAREAYDTRDWKGALDALGRAESEKSLEASDLEMRAWSLLWEAEFSEADQVFEKTHTAYVEAGDTRGAARIAIQIVRDHSARNENAIAAGWLGQVAALLEQTPECEEHALFEWILCRIQFDAGDLEKALVHADRAISMARRLGSKDVEALGLLDRGHCLLAAGKVDEAVSLHEEIIAIAMGGGLSVQVTGTVYCSVIWGSRNRGDWERASQWTDHSIRWCETVRVAQFPGLCTLHRAEVLRLRGKFEHAEREVLRACDDLLVSNASAAGSAFNELGEIRIRRGDLPGTRAAFRRAVELGMDPEPGLSRLRVEDGDAEGALKGLDRALSDPRLNAQERHVMLLTGKVEAALACGKLDVAKGALEILLEAPDLWKTPAHRAEVEACRGRLALACGEGDAALELLQSSRRNWHSIGANYEAARVQCLLAQSFEADGDPSGAKIEYEAARDAFERHGAMLDAERAAQSVTRLAASGSTLESADASVRTFVFTDIVGSTRLVEVMGDADWETLRRWHHRTLHAAFREHGGEVVGPHEGDGFFVAFVDADAAIACGVSIQRALAAHREQHGFAPQVRIGAHTSDSLRRGGDYAGKGVHIAARIASGTEGGAVTVSTATLEATRNPHATGIAREFAIEGAEEHIEIVDVEWRSTSHS